jgi:hypothetical protein
MPEESQAQSAFEQLRQEVLPHIRRPGVEAARRTVRRRRTRTALLSVVILAVVTATTWVSLRSVPPREVVVDASNSPSLVERTGTPDPSATVILPSAESTTTQQPIQPGQQTPVSPGVSTPPQNFGCLDYPVGWAKGVPTGSTAEMGFGSATNNDSGWEMCAGVRLKVKWASYTVAYGGTATFYKSGFAYLDNNTKTTTLTAELPNDVCPMWIIFGTDIPIPTTTTLQERQTQNSSGPFWDSQAKRSVAHIVGEQYTCYSKSPPPTP